jgi:hypothetical protein
MSKKLVNIHIEPVVYLKDTNDDYVLDTNGDKIELKSGVQVLPSDDYDIKQTITEY